MSHWPVRSDTTIRLGFVQVKRDSGKERESTSTNLWQFLKIIIFCENLYLNYFMSNLLYNDYILYLMHFKVLYSFLHKNVLYVKARVHNIYRRSFQCPYALYTLHKVMMLHFRILLFTLGYN